MEYVIGLIDEKLDQLAKIRRTIKVNLNDQEDMITFKEYALAGGKETLTESVTAEVMDDIINGVIHSLIIDYKIMIESAMVEGTDIYKSVHEIVPKFPIVLLTDVAKSCYEKDFVDADKVYKKSEFFKIEEDCSKEKVKNILRNMRKYSKSRAELATKLDEQLDKLIEGDAPLDAYVAVAHTERQLGDYFPQGQTEFEKTLNISDLKKAVDLLEKADELLGEKHGS